MVYSIHVAQFCRSYNFRSLIFNMIHKTSTHIHFTMRNPFSKSDKELMGMPSAKRDYISEKESIDKNHPFSKSDIESLCNPYKVKIRKESGIAFHIVKYYRGDNPYVEDYFCDHDIFTGYSGTLTEFGRAFSDKTMSEMIIALENHPDFGTSKENKSRRINWIDEDDPFSTEICRLSPIGLSKRDFYIGTLTIDFILTFGQRASVDDKVFANMIVSAGWC